MYDLNAERPSSRTSYGLYIDYFKMYLWLSSPKGPLCVQSFQRFYTIENLDDGQVTRPLF